MPSDIAWAIISSRPALKEVSTARPLRIAYPGAFYHVTATTVSDVDEIIHSLSLHFAVPEETVITTSPYRSYAIYLMRKHTPVSTTDIGRYFGDISCSAVTKMAARLKAKMQKDKTLREEMDRLTHGPHGQDGMPLLSREDEEKGNPSCIAIPGVSMRKDK